MTAVLRKVEDVDPVDQTGPAMTLFEQVADQVIDGLSNWPLATPFQFRFCLGRQVFAVGGNPHGEGVALRIRGVLGALPFHSEDRAARKRLIEALDGPYPRALGLRLRAGHVALDHQQRLTAGINLAQLLGEAASAILNARIALRPLEPLMRHSAANLLRH